MSVCAKAFNVMIEGNFATFKQHTRFVLFCSMITDLVTVKMLKQAGSGTLMVDDSTKQRKSLTSAQTLIPVEGKGVRRSLGTSNKGPKKQKIFY